MLDSSCCVPVGIVKLSHGWRGGRGGGGGGTVS